MQKKTKSIGLACVLGALIGSLISLEIAKHFDSSNYTWPIGALIGGIIAYFAYNFKQVLRAIIKTWHEMYNWRPSPNWQKIKMHLKLIFYCAIGMSGISFWILVSSIFAITKFEGLQFEPGFFIFLAILAHIVAFFITIIMTQFKMTKEQLQKELASWKTTAIKGNFVTAPIFAIYYIARLLVWLAKKIPRAVLFFARFTKKVFLLIHSEERIICFTDAAIGASIGYFAGNAIVGAILGGILGIANYEIVSIRILKIVPRS